jgi:hypothetical protein
MSGVADQNLIDQFLADDTTLAGIDFPNPQTVVRQRMMDDGITDPVTLNSIDKNSPSVRGVGLEIEALKISLRTILSTIPLLAVPVSIPTAIQTVKSHLPTALTYMTNLNMKAPSSINSVLGLIVKSEKVMKIAGKALSVPPLTPLKAIIGV